MDTVDTQNIQQPNQYLPPPNVNKQKLLFLTIFAFIIILIAASIGYVIGARNKERSVPAPIETQPAVTIQQQAASVSQQACVINQGADSTIEQAMLNPSSICRLIINNNIELKELAALTTHLTRLIDLTVNGTTDTALPPEISNLKTLYTLTIRETEKTVIPEQIEQLSNLRNLYIALTFRLK